jgi:hypothetical protein
MLRNGTVVEGVKKTGKIVVEKMVVNPNLEASRFSKPQ